MSLTTLLTSTSPTSIGRLITESGINLSAFSGQLAVTTLDAEAAAKAQKTIDQFQAWLRIHHPDHPALAFKIMHVDFAVEAAGIDKTSSFSTEAAAGCKTANSHCPEDQAKWFDWLNRANALHKCNWAEDENSILRDISEAIEKKVSILVIERIG
jgi:hypothetical protein